MTSAARPLVQVFDGADASSQQVLPHVFLAPIRPDIVHFVHSNMNKNARHAYGAKFQAGMGHSAHSWGTGRAVARIPRVSGGGTSRAGQAAFGNMCRKGRMYAQTKTFRKWHRKINTNQKRYAVASALAATAIPSLVMARGHSVAGVPELPLVVSDAFESLTKTAAAVKLLTGVGAYADVQKAGASKKVRRGRGKMRNRRHVLRKGPLVVYANDNGIVKACRNLPGVDVCCVTRLNLLQLAPGGHLGRFVVWTEGAFAQLNSIWGSTKTESKQKSGYKLPYGMMTNSDITRVINSDEVQSRVRPAIKTVKYSARVKKNPLKNFGTMVKLNPYALTLRRSELLTAERRAATKANTLAAARAGADAPISLEKARKTAARKTHAPRKSVNRDMIFNDDFEAVQTDIKVVAPVTREFTETQSFSASSSSKKKAPKREAKGKSSAPPSKKEKKSNKKAGWSLPKCLAYTKKALIKGKYKDFEVNGFMGELEQRWRHVDVDLDGRIDQNELKLAVWNNEADNKGKKCPKGKLPRAQQEIVDEIIKGTGNQKDFDFWDFLVYVIDDREARDDIKVRKPPTKDTWAHA